MSVVVPKHHMMRSLYCSAVADSKIADALYVCDPVPVSANRGPMAESKKQKKKEKVGTKTREKAQRVWKNKERKKK